jgi:peroxiredoxin Q/BCP
MTTKHSRATRGTQGRVMGGWAVILSLLLGSAGSETVRAEAKLKVGEALPEFSVKNQHGKTVSSKDLKGKPYLLYFYPKDETPGCTKQACALRDEFAAFKKRGALVFGVSKQDAESHRAFIQKHRIPFDLLIDEEGKLAAQLGVGTYPVVGLHQRQSLLVDAEGKLIRFYESVDPAGHPAEVLKDLDQAKK